MLYASVVVLLLLFTITLTGVYTLLPKQLPALQARMVYYLFGSQPDMRDSVGRLVTGLTNSSAREL